MLAGMRVSNIILRVSNMTRSLRFYRDEVGIPVVWESSDFSFLDAGTIRLALNQPVDGVAPDESLTEIVLEVDDVHATYESMVERGVVFRIAPREVMREGERALHAADFRDPDEHVLSITGWVHSG